MNVTFDKRVNLKKKKKRRMFRKIKHLSVFVEYTSSIYTYIF